MERINYVIKNSNVSGGSASPEVVAFRAFLKKRRLDGASERVFALARDDDDAAIEALDDIKQAFAVSSSDTASTILAEIATRYGETDGSNLVDVSPHRAGDLVTRWRGGSKSIRVDAVLLQSLRACLLRLQTDTRIDPFPRRPEDANLPYCPNKATFRAGIEWGGVRIDAAEWSVEHSFNPDYPSCIALVNSRNSVIEIRSHVTRYAYDTGSTAALGVLTKIFEHQIFMPDGTEGSKRLFGVFRRFIAHAGLDMYDYRAQ